MVENSRVDAAEMAALRQRFPKLPPAAVAYQSVAIVATNAFLLYLVVAGKSSPVAIAAYGIVELIALSVIAHLALIPVPKELRVGDPDMPIVQRISVIGLSLIWLAGIYYVSLCVDIDRLRQTLHTAGVLTALEDLNILWPLLISAALAAFGMLGDWSDWHRRGGMFVPKLAMSAAPKILTLIVAPIPAVLIAEAWAKSHPGTAAIAWSLVYLAIKAIAELGMLAWQAIGMPESTPDADKLRRRGRTAAK